MQKISFKPARISTLFSALFLSTAAIAQTTPPPAPAVTPPPVPAPAVTPPPLPAVPQISVFVAQNGAQTGPFNAEQLKGLVASGALKADTLVWKEGMGDWAAANTVPELASLLSANAPTADPVAYLTGSWSGTASGVPIPGVGTGSITITTVYNADLTVNAYGTITANTANGPTSITITMEGTYKAQQIDPTTILVTPNVRITYSAPGMTPESSTDSTPGALTILSPISFRDGEGIVYTKR